MFNECILCASSPAFIAPWDTLLTLQIRKLRSREVNACPGHTTAKWQGWHLYPHLLTPVPGHLITIFYSLTSVSGSHPSSPFLLPPSLVQTLEFLIFTIFIPSASIFLLPIFPPAHQVQIFLSISIWSLYVICLLAPTACKSSPILSKAQATLLHLLSLFSVIPHCDLVTSKAQLRRSRL